MKIKQYGPRIEELRQEGKTIREIAADVGLKHEQVKGCFSRTRREQRQRGYPRSRKNDGKLFRMFKTEAFRPCKPQTIHQAQMLVHDYIDYYNNERMRLK